MDSLGNLTAILNNVPIDWFIFAGIIVAFALDSLRSGVGRAIALSVALPVAFFLFTLIPATAGLGTIVSSQTSTIQLGIFLALVIAVYFLVRRMGLDFVDGGRGEPIQALLGGAAVAVVFVSVWLQMPILSDLWAFSEQLRTIFSEGYRLFWIVGAYAALAFARG